MQLPKTLFKLISKLNYLHYTANAIWQTTNFWDEWRYRDL